MNSSQTCPKSGIQTGWQVWWAPDRQGGRQMDRQIGTTEVGRVAGRQTGTTEVGIGPRQEVQKYNRIECHLW